MFPVKFDRELFSKHRYESLALLFTKADWSYRLKVIDHEFGLHSFYWWASNIKTHKMMFFATFIRFNWMFTFLRLQIIQFHCNQIDKRRHFMVTVPAEGDIFYQEDKRQKCISDNFLNFTFDWNAISLWLQFKSFCCVIDSHHSASQLRSPLPSSALYTSTANDEQDDGDQEDQTDKHNGWYNHGCRSCNKKVSLYVVTTLHKTYLNSK